MATKKKTLSIGLKMAEMFLSVMLFGLHAVATIWWGSVTMGNWKVVSMISATAICSPVIPLMFRVEPYLYTKREVSKPINIFIIIYCMASYMAGSVVILIDAIGSRSENHSKDVAVGTSVVCFILVSVFVLDLIHTILRRR
ncbi:uncharacterized protein LOC106665199 [Cimex lectularius]|uniref:MARVEL domain-containing protein n=1 Tax=Cimex lectularius TaxID=79782 RepID=A0A8I6RKC4_CIMLE|nr:uncharacterized protein LOC106665199 [Cimex lectularius]